MRAAQKESAVTPCGRSAWLSAFRRHAMPRVAQLAQWGAFGLASPKHEVTSEATGLEDGALFGPEPPQAQPQCKRWRDPQEALLAVRRLRIGGAELHRRPPLGPCRLMGALGKQACVHAPIAAKLNLYIKVLNIYKVYIYISIYISHPHVPIAYIYNRPQTHAETRIPYIVYGKRVDVCIRR